MCNLLRVSFRTSPLPEESEGGVCQNKEEIKFRILEFNLVGEVAEDKDVSCGFAPLTGWF